MALTYIRRAAVAISVLAAASCTVKSTTPPPLTGPSQLGLTLQVNAIPDSISQDGGSQSSVKITAIGPDGKGLSGVPLRLDMSVNGTVMDFGALSARSVVTDANGVATSVYTAPPASNGTIASCSGVSGNCVSIIATATSTNFTVATPQTVMIRLVPTGVVLPPATTPTAQFSYSPTPVTLNTPVTFDASASCGAPLTGTSCAIGTSAITAYTWNFGDGTSGSGRVVSHTFSGSGTSFSVSLTVTNDRGVSSTTTQAVGVSVSPAPSGDWTFSPTAPVAGSTVFFNGDAVQAAAGHTLVQFVWNFGDGTTATGTQPTHIFSQAATYNVSLSVADETGQKTVITKGVVIGNGNPTAAITFSPTAPTVNTTVNFSSAGSTTTGNATISSYLWDLGDGSSSTAASPSHAYSAKGSYTVRLTITDSQGRSGTVTTTVTVS